MADEPKLCSPIRSTCEAMAVWCIVAVVLEKNRALSFVQCLLQALQFSVPFIDLLSLLLRWNSLARIQKAVVDHTGRRTPNSDHGLFWVHVWEAPKGAFLSNH